MASHPEPALTSEQQQMIARIAEERAAHLIAQALAGAHERLAAAIASTVVMLPVVHAEDVIQMEARDHG